jgi:hypothetical protein
MLSYNAVDPIATFSLPEMLLYKAETPMAVL